MKKNVKEFFELSLLSFVAFGIVLHLNSFVSGHEKTSGTQQGKTVETPDSAQINMLKQRILRKTR